MTATGIVMLAAALFTLAGCAVMLHAIKKDRSEREWFAKLCKDTYEEARAEARATNERKETTCKAGLSLSPSSASTETVATAKNS